MKNRKKVKVETARGTCPRCSGPDAEEGEIQALHEVDTDGSLIPTGVSLCGCGRLWSPEGGTVEVETFLGVCSGHLVEEGCPACGDHYGLREGEVPGTSLVLCSDCGALLRPVDCDECRDSMAEEWAADLAMEAARDRARGW